MSVKFKNKKIPVKLGFGSPNKSQRAGGLFGLGMEVSGTKHQLFRMDYHKWNDGHIGGQNQLKMIRYKKYHTAVYKW